MKGVLEMKLDYQVKCTNEECGWEVSLKECDPNQCCPKCGCAVKKRDEKEAIPWSKHGLWIDPDKLAKCSDIVIWGQRVGKKYGGISPWVALAHIPLGDMDWLKNSKNIFATYITCEEPWKDHWQVCHHEWEETVKDKFECKKCGLFCEDEKIVEEIRRFLALPEGDQ